MSQPTRGDVHVNRPLTNISIAFIQSAEDFIAEKVFPLIPVSKQADKYFVYDREQWFRTDAEKRAPSTESAGTGFNLSTDEYFADVWALHQDVDDQTRANQDEPIQLDRDATQLVTQQLMLRKEKEFVSNFMQTSIWGSDFSPVTKWDAAGSDPVADVRIQRRNVKKITGFAPNKFVVSADTDDALKDNASVIDRLKITTDKIVTNDLLARLFQVDEYLVMEAVENTAKEGATGVFNHLLTEQALLVYSEPNPGILKPSGGYTFTWSGLLGAQRGMRMKKFRMEQLESDRMEGQMAFDQKLVAADLGIFFDNILT